MYIWIITCICAIENWRVFRSRGHEKFGASERGHGVKKVGKHWFRQTLLLIHGQNHVQGKWAASHPHLSFLHGNLETHPHLINSSTERGARWTSDGKVTGFKVFDASSLLQPYFVISTFEGLVDKALFQIVAWKWARFTFSLKAWVEGGNIFKSGPVVTFFWLLFWTTH